MGDEDLDRLVAELRQVGTLCLEPLPDYQVFLGTREALSDKVITTARDGDGTLIGFCSAVLLPIEGVGRVLHLGLTCVHPAARGKRLTYALVEHLVIRYFVTKRLLGRLWVTNVAAVLSSLGNFARSFFGVYPSPWSHADPGPTVWRIAEAFDARYRHVAYVQPWATFDRATFVFRGSGRGTCFQKEADATEFHHREAPLNDYYKPMLNWDDGDEMLQIGSLSLADIARFKLFGARRV